MADCNSGKNSIHGIPLELPTSPEDITGPSSCSAGAPGSECVTDGDVSKGGACSCGSGLPACVPGIKGCPECIPPDTVPITATPRDPYYVDELAVAINESSEGDRIIVSLDKNVPIIRSVTFRGTSVPGEAGVPKNIRADIDTFYFGYRSLNVIGSIPQQGVDTRQVSIRDRINNRWITFIYHLSAPLETHSRISKAYFGRGRGIAPWWTTGFPDGTSSTGIG